MIAKSLKRLTSGEQFPKKKPKKKNQKAAKFLWTPAEINLPTLAIEAFCRSTFLQIWAPFFIHPTDIFFPPNPLPPLENREWDLVEYIYTELPLVTNIKRCPRVLRQKLKSCLSRWDSCQKREGIFPTKKPQGSYSNSIKTNFSRKSFFGSKFGLGWGGVDVSAIWDLCL